MKLYGGIDLYSKNFVVAIINEQGETLTVKRLNNDMSVILSFLSPYKDNLKELVVESTFNWYWLVDALMDAEFKLHLANPAAIQQYSGLKYADDHSDVCVKWAKPIHKRSDAVFVVCIHLLSFAEYNISFKFK